MTQAIAVKPGKCKGYMMVRDSNGKPKFDNINNIDQHFWDMLSEDEKLTIQLERKNGQ